MPTGKGFADICFPPRKKYADKPALIIGLKWDKTAQGAIAQIEEKQYVDALKDYKGNLIVAGVNYDKKTKEHHAEIKMLKSGKKMRTEKCGNVFQKYDVNFCYLFGSYAKSKAKPTSDVDLLISANVKGLKFYGLVEEIREALHKKVDVLEINQLKDNLELTQEILKDGIKIYG